MFMESVKVTQFAHKKRNSVFFWSPFTDKIIELRKLDVGIDARALFLRQLQLLRIVLCFCCLRIQLSNIIVSMYVNLEMKTGLPFGLMGFIEEFDRDCCFAYWKRRAKIGVYNKIWWQPRNDTWWLPRLLMLDWSKIYELVQSWQYFR